MMMSERVSKRGKSKKIIKKIKCMPIYGNT
jgi:hypothetical protein